MIVRAADLEVVLRFIEEAVRTEAVFNPEFERELGAAGTGIPEQLYWQISQATRSLLAPSQKGDGKFLVVTGIDRTGKETQCFNPRKLPEVTSVHEYLVSKGHHTLTVMLPAYDTVLGGLVAAYLGVPRPGLSIYGELPTEVAWILWSLDRVQHNHDVQAWLQNSEHVVLSKRWTETNIAYQMAKGIEPERMLAIERNIIKQDYTIVLDAPVERIFGRIENSGEKADKHEQDLELLEKVRQNYLILPKHYPFGQFTFIDASGAPHETNMRVLQTLAQLGFN